jgi:transposase
MQLGSQLLIIRDLGVNAVALYSLDLRERVVRACDDRMGTRQEIAEMLGVSVSFITKLLRRRSRENSIAAKPHRGGGKASLDQNDLKRVRQFVDEQPDATLSELCERLRSTGGPTVHLWTMCRMLKHLGLVRKKSLFTPRSATRLASSDCVGSGAVSSGGLIRTSWCSSMKAE